MDLCCKQLQAEDTVTIHTSEDATFYTRLRFSLLASNWLPRPLGVLLWSLLHITLLVCVPPLLLVAVTLVLLVPLSLDVLFLIIRLPALAFFVGLSIPLFPILLVVYALDWLWRVATGERSTVPATVQAQSEPDFAQPPRQAGRARRVGGRHVVLREGRRTDPDEDCLWNAVWAPFLTVLSAQDLALAWGPYWRLKLGSWYREITTLDDAIAI